MVLAVKLDVHDANAHLITNTSGSQGGPVAVPMGVTGLATNNVGQFVQIGRGSSVAARGDARAT